MYRSIDFTFLQIILISILHICITVIRLKLIGLHRLTSSYLILYFLQKSTWNIMICLTTYLILKVRIEIFLLLNQLINNSWRQSWIYIFGIVNIILVILSIRLVINQVSAKAVSFILIKLWHYWSWVPSLLVIDLGLAWIL